LAGGAPFASERVAKASCEMMSRRIEGVRAN
jgi:hypothetical protein